MGISNRLDSLEKKTRLLLGERQKRTEEIDGIERAYLTIPKLRARIEAINADIGAIRRVIHIDHPDWNHDHLTPSVPFEHKIPIEFGSATKLALDILRTASEPMTMRQLASEVLLRANVTNPHPHTIAQVANSIGNSLRKRHTQGFIANDGEYPARWWAVKPAP